MLAWLDRHVLHIGATLACLTCLLVGMAIGLTVGGHSLFTVFHRAPPQTRIVHAPARTVTVQGKDGAVSTHTDTAPRPPW